MPRRRLPAVPPLRDPAAVTVSADRPRARGDRRRRARRRRRGRRPRVGHRQHPRPGPQADHDPHVGARGEGDGVQHAPHVRRGAAGGLPAVRRAGGVDPDPPRQVPVHGRRAHRGDDGDARAAQLLHRRAQQGAALAQGGRHDPAARRPPEGRDARDDPRATKIGARHRDAGLAPRVLRRGGRERRRLRGGALLAAAAGGDVPDDADALQRVERAAEGGSSSCRRRRPTRRRRRRRRRRPSARRR